MALWNANGLYISGMNRHEILSGGLRGLTSPYGEYWRKWRKVGAFGLITSVHIIHPLTDISFYQIQRIGMSGRASLAYREHQTLESAILLRDLASNTKDHVDTIQRHVLPFLCVPSPGHFRRFIFADG